MAERIRSDAARQPGAAGLIQLYVRNQSKHTPKQHRQVL